MRKITAVWKSLQWWRRPKPKRRLDRVRAVDLLTEACELLDASGHRCWLTDGTLLGLYRDGDFIAHDVDIDLGFPIEGFDFDLTERFVAAGWSLHSICGRISAGLEVSFEKDGTKLDVFVFYREADTVWHGAWLDDRQVKGQRRLIRYVYPRFELERATYLGRDFSVPACQETYVRTKYGDDWRTPVADWDWAYSPANARPTETYGYRLKRPKRLRQAQAFLTTRGK